MDNQKVWGLVTHRAPDEVKLAAAHPAAELRSMIRAAAFDLNYSSLLHHGEAILLYEINLECEPTAIVFGYMLIPAAGSVPNFL